MCEYQWPRGCQCMSVHMELEYLFFIFLIIGVKIVSKIIKLIFWTPVGVLIMV